MAPPPFLGVRDLELPLCRVLGALDEQRLFRTRWHYRRGSLSEEGYRRLLEDEARPALATWRRRALAETLIRPRAVYGFFRCVAEAESLYVLEPEADAVLASFRFPRQEEPPHRCLVDSFRRRSEGVPDVLAAFVVTVGEEPSLRLGELFAADRYRELLQLHGLAAEAAECATELVHARIRGELAASSPEPTAEGQRWRRFSFGYPGCPDLEAQRPLLKLLAADRIGVTLTDGAQLVPEQSVSAVVFRQPADADRRFRDRR